jgi:hypothetical protein
LGEREKKVREGAHGAVMSKYVMRNEKLRTHVLENVYTSRLLSETI